MNWPVVFLGAGTALVLSACSIYITNWRFWVLVLWVNIHATLTGIYV